MSSLAQVRDRVATDGWLAAAAVVTNGVGVALLLAGVALADVALVLAGSFALAVGLVVLFTGGWVSGLLILALTLPLPAPYDSGGGFRASPAAALTAIVLFSWVLRRALTPRHQQTGSAAAALSGRSGPVSGPVREGERQTRGAGPEKRPRREHPPRDRSRHARDGRHLASPSNLGPLPRRSMLAFLAALLLSMAFAGHLLPAVREVVTLALMLGLLAVATDEIRSVPGRARQLAFTIAGVAGLAGPFAALEAVGVLPGEFPLEGTSFQRATLGFGWPNELGMFFALALPLSLFAFRASASLSGRTLAAAGLGGVVLGLAATFSRGSWLALLAAALVLLFTDERRLVLRVWLAGLAAIVVLDLASGGAVHERILGTAGDWVLEQRAALMLAGLLMFWANPIVGVGPGGFAENLDRFGPQITWLWDYVGSPHNTYVHVAAETGLIGLGAFLVFIGTIFFMLLRSARNAGGGADHVASEAPFAAISSAAGIQTSRPGTESRFLPNDEASHPAVSAVKTPTSGGGSLSTDEARLRHALLWSFAAGCAVSMIEWSFAHGIGQLFMLVAAAGLALSSSLSPASATASRAASERRHA